MESFALIAETYHRKRTPSNDFRHFGYELGNPNKCPIRFTGRINIHRMLTRISQNI